MIEPMWQSTTRREPRISIRYDQDQEIPVDSTLDDGNDYNVGYPTCHERKIVVQVFQMVDGESKTIEGQLLDFSKNGVKVFIHSKMEIGDAISLRIQFGEMDIDFSSAATVCWTGFKSHGNWIIGCSLASEIPDIAFERIINTGYLERRRVERQKISVEARICRTELDDEQTEVRLDDFSMYGFGMFSPQSFNSGDTVLLEVQGGCDSTVHIPAEVQWQKAKRSGYSVGCEFMSINGFEIFRDALLHTKQVNRTTQVVHRSCTSRWLSFLRSLIGRR